MTSSLLQEILDNTKPHSSATLWTGMSRSAGLIEAVHWVVSLELVVYYESRKRELKTRLMNEGWCDENKDERLKVRVEESTCLTYTVTCCLL